MLHYILSWRLDSRCFSRNDPIHQTIELEPFCISKRIKDLPIIHYTSVCNMYTLVSIEPSDPKCKSLNRIVRWSHIAGMFWSIRTSGISNQLGSMIRSLPPLTCLHLKVPLCIVHSHLQVSSQLSRYKIQLHVFNNHPKLDY